MVGVGFTPAALIAGVRDWMNDGTGGIAWGMPDAEGPPSASIWPGFRATSRSWMLLTYPTAALLVVLPRIREVTPALRANRLSRPAPGPVPTCWPSTYPLTASAVTEIPIRCQVLGGMEP